MHHLAKSFGVMILSLTAWAKEPDLVPTSPPEGLLLEVPGVQSPEGHPSAFYRYQFYDNHRLQLYAILAGKGVANRYYHYFVNTDGVLQYLGEYPRVSYDEATQTFIALEKSGPDKIKTTYRLQEGRWQEVSSVMERNFIESQEDHSHPFPGLNPDCLTINSKAMAAAAYLKKVITCALYELYPNSRYHHAREKTIDLIVERLAQQFPRYGIKSDIEKAHFLAQTIQETNTLLSMVERRYYRGSPWHRLFVDPAPLWNCQGYLDAIDGDRSFFNNRYDYSKDSYKSTFRGRGLFQLTHCYNYLGFYFHRAAVHAEDLSLADEMRTLFYYLDPNSGRQREVGSFCSQDTLEQVADNFVDMGYPLDASEFAVNFELSVNQLSVPCYESEVYPLNSQEFIVDSALWYWKNCQRGKSYAQYVDQRSDTAVAKISHCIHRDRRYHGYDSSSCKKVPEGAHWTLGSYCSRLKMFNVLDSYFQVGEV